MSWLKNKNKTYLLIFCDKVEFYLDFILNDALACIEVGLRIAEAKD